jgi:hypothetical protein
MTNPTGIICDYIRDWIERFPGRVESYIWVGDSDTSSAAAAIPIALGTLKAVDASGANAYKLRKGYGVPEILGILGIDESGGGIDGYLQIQGRARKIRFGKISVVAANEWWGWIPRKPLQVPEGSQLDVIGNKSGGGAEQHAVIVYVHYPKLAKPRLAGEYPSSYGPLGLKTGTRIAQTAGPFTAYPLTGLEDTELAFASDPSLKFALEQCINGPGLADTSVVVLRWPGMETDQYEIAFPASMAGGETIFSLPMVEFTADNPVKLGAIGNSTTSDEYAFVIGCSAQFGDTNAASNASGAPAASPPATNASPQGQTIGPAPPSNPFTGLGRQYGSGQGALTLQRSGY